MAEYIKRKDAINALWKALYEFEDKMEETVTKDPYLDIDDWLISRIHVQSCHADCIDAVNSISSADVVELTDRNVGKWIPVSEKLPEDREIVIACWFNIHCIKKYNVSVLRFMKGRASDEIERGTPIYGCDQYGNNKVPYCWHSTEGAHDHFGQEVTHWIPLPDPPKEETDVLL